MTKAGVPVSKNARNTELEETYFKLLIAYHRPMCAWSTQRASEGRPQYAGTFVEPARAVTGATGRGGQPGVRKHGQGKPVFDYNSLGLEQFRWKGPQALSPGNHTIVFDFKYDGPASGRGALAC